MYCQSCTKPTTQRDTRQHLQKTRTKRKRNPPHGIPAICRKTESNNGKSAQIKLIEANTLTHFCGECRFATVQIDIDKYLRKRHFFITIKHATNGKTTIQKIEEKFTFTPLSPAKKCRIMQPFINAN